MRKIITILAMLMLACCLTLAVSAADGNSQRIQVTAKCETESYAPASYCLEISWTDMNFVYTRSQTHTWNPKNHSYKTTTKKKWTDKEATIKVTNHSNAEVTVEIANSNVMDGVTLTWDKETLTLPTADNGENGAAGTPTTDSALLTVTGTITDTGAKQTLGTVTITLKTN